MGAEISDQGRSGVFLHCARYVEQQAVGVVPMAPAETVTLTERYPGNDENFLNSDFFALVSGDHVITLNAGRSAGALHRYLHQLFQRAKCPESWTQFDIVRIADINGLRRIDAGGGVEKVQLDLAIEEASAGVVRDEAANPTMVQRLRRPLVQMLQSLVRADGKAAGAAQSRKGTMRVMISVPGRDLEVAKSGLDGIAEQIVADEEAEDYVIWLRSGESIKPGEIAVKKKVSVVRSANTVQPGEVREEMLRYLAELRQARQTEI
ncbi:MAG: hypothetical protein CVT82_00265 [Alphaproteobacteria bacterium HGW-Alphaproteobacteria-4]|nr:MAG: hypothetical protein CVT82_00265 [Alphaproteobacteria bacterium HGW-Alphaproteobacteria-4]